MKVAEYMSIYRNDFTARMVCEHCGHEQKLMTGYYDAYYFRFVIPAMTCEACGRNRAGETPEQRNDTGAIHVAARKGEA